MLTSHIEAVYAFGDSLHVEAIEAHVSQIVLRHEAERRHIGPVAVPVIDAAQQPVQRWGEIMFGASLRC
jgi:hypothetical protein